MKPSKKNMASTIDTSSSLATMTNLLLLLVSSLAYNIQGTHAAGECGKTPVSSAAATLAPCVAAAKSTKVTVPPACCTKVAALLQASPKCLCAVFLSPLAKQVGINLAVAITVPKRCNIKNRPVGKKCGKYVVP
ncbi:non-specific lipid transfer protein GPI-anchored 31 [Telopea speciosissima]|uniref:non-specific lipid transfer protein GPI-anchored 31 n=1 Tax=Telopea speciosissima TaxID=54955 RepID=UPI001CC79F4D|nr:non-specific lipid transfer protein GPI-anchored 31 [Telopea speciosissima]